jgi:polar amino acid transport system substrate-binding protein
MPCSLRALLFGLLVLVLSACQSLSTEGVGTGESAPGRLQRIVESGELRVGLSGNQPPLNMKNQRGEIIGLEVELIEALARSMELEVRLVAMPFADLLPSLEKGDVDLVISGMTITPERNARVAFVGPYVISGKSLLTRSKEIANVESTAALDLPDRTYAALRGSTSQDFVTTNLPQTKLVTTRDYDAAVKMVIDGEVDAMIADYPICALSVLRHPEAGLSMLVTPFTVEPLGIALPADAPLFVNLVENYLHTMDGTGLLIQLKAKWFSDGSWISELP